MLPCSKSIANNEFSLSLRRQNAFGSSWIHCPFVGFIFFKCLQDVPALVSFAQSCKLRNQLSLGSPSRWGMKWLLPVDLGTRLKSSHRPVKSHIKRELLQQPYLCSPQRDFISLNSGLDSFSASSGKCYLQHYSSTPLMAPVFDLWQLSLCEPQKGLAEECWLSLKLRGADKKLDVSLCMSSGNLRSSFGLGRRRLLF